MTIIEDRSRALKASRLVDVLTQAGATAATIPCLDDAGWAHAARAAGVPAPSETTRALVARWFVEREQQPADPFAGLDNAVGVGGVTGPIRAPAGAVGWTASAGYLFDSAELTHRATAGEVVLVVPAEGMLRGVTPDNRAPLLAVLRLDGDLVDVVTRLDDLSDRIDQVTRMHDALAEPVSDLGDRAAGLDTGLAVEVSTLKGRVRKLEERSR